MNKNKTAIEDIYPLSPMQHGMLFHTLLAPQSGAYFQQLACSLHGEIDTAALRRAWQKVVERQTVLRTAFIWKNRDEPLQVVCRNVSLPWEELDWRQLSEDEQEKRFGEFLHTDRKLGFDLAKPPLMRVALVRLTETGYRFVWSHHHLLMDGWCRPLILKEVFALYESDRRQREATLESSRPYGDYLVWLKQQSLSGAETFWRNLLKGFNSPTPLGVDQLSLSAQAQEEAYGERQLKLSAATSDGLFTFARRRQLTLNTLIQGAWAILLGSYSGEEEVVFGTTVSGRPAELQGVESMIGLFINTIPVRTRLGAGHTLLSWLHGLQAQQAESRQYEHSPLVQIQGWSDVPRGLPLFESIFIFENYPVDESLQQREGSLQVDDFRSFEQTNYPLTIIAEPGKQIALRILYDCRRFNPSTIERMLGHLHHLLDSIVADPDQSLAQLHLLTPAEHQFLVIDSNDTAHPFPHLLGIHHLFEQQVARSPSAVALSFEDNFLTYSQLNERANCLAHFLRQLGVGPDTLIAVFMHRSVEMVVALLGILKAGAAYVPLDPEYPRERILFMLADAQTEVILTQQSLIEGLPEGSATVVALDTGWDEISVCSNENPQVGVEPDHLAYVIYTSGSTGRPKGVMVPHRCVVNFLSSMSVRPGLNSTDRLVAVTTLSFDIAALELYLPLVTGAQVRVASRIEATDARQLMHLLREASVMQATPATWRMLVEAGWKGTAHFKALCGGEALETELAQELVTRAGEVWNLYGPTETTIWSAATQVEAGTARVSIGGPIRNTQLYVLDERMRAVPVGVMGELYIGGVGVCRGYYRRPELTAERFVPDPFDNGGGRLYRTGDVARYREDGAVEYVGRMDAQVKVRGYRIELGEIESVVREQVGVRECVVVARGEGVEKRLVGYVVGEGISIGEIRRGLSERLPEYMVPQVLMELEELPLTPNGKVDRRALPEVSGARPELGQEVVEARTEVEEVLAGIWSEVLGVERVGVFDNFFELGGHSLLAMKIASRAREIFKIELSLRIFFEKPTIAGLAGNIEMELRDGSADYSTSIAAVRRDEQIPLSFSQQRLFFLDKLEPGNTAYNIPAALRLTGPIKVAELQAALNEIVRRHEILRTTFEMWEEQPVQVIADALSLAVPVVDLREVEEAERGVLMQHALNVEAQRRFDLTRGPLLRVVLLKLREEEHVLAVTMHHIISDRWSMDILVKELCALYAVNIGNQTTTLADLPIQYADYAVWQRRHLQGEVLAKQLAYWKRQLAGHTDIELPTTGSRPPVQSYRGAFESFELSTGLTESLTALSRREGVTLFMTTLAALQTLLQRYTGQIDIAVGTPVANRGRAELEGLIGCFVNTLVLRTDFSGEPNFRQLLKRVREMTLGAYAHQDLPFEQLLEHLQLERDLSRHPLFQVMLVLERKPVMTPELSGLHMTEIDMATAASKFDMQWNLLESDSGIRGTVEYSTDLFDRQTIRRMISHFQALLDSIISAPDQSLAQLRLLTPAEHQFLVIDANDTAHPFPHLLALHHLFEHQVARSPSAIALTFEDNSLTYSQLDERANCLAHYLRQHGVGPDTLVAVFMHRSIEMVVALLGILKAGAAYVPLDPEYPRERILFMLADAQTEVILTQASLVEDLPEGSATVIALDTGWDEISACSGENPQVGVEPDHLAYVIYTSGSTGRPKAAMNTHRAIVNRLCWMQSAYGLSSSDRVLQKTPFSFDVSVWEFFWPLLSGARLVMARPGGHRDSAYLVGVIVAQEITTLHFVPSMLEVFVEEAGVEGCVSVRRVISSGEALPVELVERYHRRLSAPLHNLYGPTEAAVDVSAWECRRDGERERVPIGRPIWNTQLYVLDERMRAVPVGVTGELYIGGVGVGRGYYRRPGLTAERFVPDPFDGEGGRLYRTGDVARYREDGAVEYVGRVDAQVKVRGYRIELGEIESVVREQVGVRECVVVARGEGVEKRLVGYVVGEGISIGEIRRGLSERLPEYMVPQVIVELEEMPLTPNGKVDRRALPEVSGARPELAAGYEGARTAEEELLAGIWSEVLGVERVGIHDNFFSLGGDSIRSLQVRSLAARQGLDISIQQLFRYQTIGELALRVEKGENHPEDAPRHKPFALLSEGDLVKLPDGVDDVYPLTALQSGMLFHSEYTADSPIYHDIFSFDLKARFDFDLLQRAARQLVSRHEALRTSFDLNTFSEPMQVVNRFVEAPVLLEDLRHLSAEAQEHALATWTESEKKRRFEWMQPPLFAFHIHRRSDETFRLSLSFHHAILDGWSVALMLTELFWFYLSLQGDRKYSVEPVPATSFRDYVVLEREAQASHEARQFWLEKLSDITVGKLPRLRSSVNPETAQRVLDVPVGEEVSDELRRIAREVAVPIKSVLLAAHLRVMKTLYGHEDVLTGLVANGRPETADGERALGLFLNTVPLRLKLSGGTWKDLIRETFAAEQELLPYRRYPLASLQKGLAGESLFETSFNFNHFHVYQGMQGLAEIEVLSTGEFEQTNFTFGANFRIDVSTSQVQLQLQYNSAEVGTELAAVIGDYYLKTLAAIAGQPDGHHESLSLLSASELQQLAGWNDTAALYNEDACLHTLFERQAENAPDALAVVFEDRRVTYSELNHRANRLAHFLRRQGVGHDSLVPVLMHRSVEMVVALLGILKAGAAYIPLDPEYPRERILFMLADAQAGVILTQQSLVEGLPEGSATVIALDTGWDEIGAYSNENPQVRVEPEHLAYVIYTSGSTGEPRGVMVSHGGVCNTLHARQEAYGLSASDSMLQNIPFSFDPSVWQIFGMLVAGGRLSLARPGGQQDISYLLRLIDNEEITLVDFVPSMLQVVLGEVKKGDFRHVRHVFCGGEVLPVELQEQFFSTLDAKLHNMYGPTETSIDATSWTCRRGESLTNVPIGRPIANKRIYLLDAQLQHVPVGVPGELHIGGYGLARGYLNRPELTAEKFVPDPFSPEAGARLYRTGDLARFVPDGRIEYLGRVDYQVKIRGFRIEPGEIEAVLARHPDLDQALVVAREDVAGEKRLVAYVVGKPGVSPSGSELRSFMKAALPDHMVPGAYVIMDEMPLLPNGKIDRRSLPAPNSQQRSAESDYLAPRTEAEQIIAEIWQEALQVERVGVNDNFFDLGGHSILMLRVHGKLRERFKRDMEIVEMFRYPTVSMLAEHFVNQPMQQLSSRPSQMRAEQSRAATKRRKLLRQNQAAATAIREYEHEQPEQL